jgi:hypothetical protein
LSAVSEGFVSREDLYSDEATAKIRLFIGTQLYRDKINERLRLCNFAYSAIFALITGIGKYTEQSFEQNKEGLRTNFRQLFAAIAGTEYKKEEEDAVSSEVQQMVNLYNYLFS